jgi:hypothetical protein
LIRLGATKNVVQTRQSADFFGDEFAQLAGQLDA